VFSHVAWHVRCYRAGLAPGHEIRESADVRWASRSEVDGFPMPTVQRKVLAALHEGPTSRRRND